MPIEVHAVLSSHLSPCSKSCPAAAHWSLLFRGDAPDRNGIRTGIDLDIPAEYVWAPGRNGAPDILDALSLLCSVPDPRLVPWCTRTVLLATIPTMEEATSLIGTMVSTSYAELPEAVNIATRAAREGVPYKWTCQNWVMRMMGVVRQVGVTQPKYDVQTLMVYWGRVMYPPSHLVTDGVEQENSRVSDN